MRPAYRFTVLLLALGVTASREARSQRIARPIQIPVHSCAVADSVLGTPKDEPTSLRGDAFPNRDTLYAYVGEMLRDGVEASARVSKKAGADEPDAQLFFYARGADARALLADSEARRVALVLDDTTFDMGPARAGVVVGSLARAGAGFNVWLEPFMFLKLAQAQHTAVRLGSLHFGAPDFARDIKALYRAARCGLKRDRRSE